MGTVGSHTRQDFFLHFFYFHIHYSWVFFVSLMSPIEVESRMNFWYLLYVCFVIAADFASGCCTNYKHVPEQHVPERCKANVASEQNWSSNARSGMCKGESCRPVRQDWSFRPPPPLPRDMCPGCKCPPGETGHPPFCRPVEQGLELEPAENLLTSDEIMNYEVKNDDRKTIDEVIRDAGKAPGSWDWTNNE